MHPACDRAIADHAGAYVGTRSQATARPRLILATTILASSLAFIDGSVVNVGLPAVSRSLGASGPSLTWVLNGYTLPLGALLLLGGALGDIFGRSRLLILGVGLFTAASILCALSPTLTWLLAGRVFQGIGAATIYLAARFVRNETQTNSSIDLLGAALVTAALTMLTWALTIASSTVPLGAGGFAMLGVRRL